MKRNLPHTPSHKIVDSKSLTPITTIAQQRQPLSSPFLTNFASKSFTRRTWASLYTVLRDIAEHAATHQIFEKQWTPSLTTKASSVTADVNSSKTLRLGQEILDSCTQKSLGVSITFFGTWNVLKNCLRDKSLASKILLNMEECVRWGIIKGTSWTNGGADWRGGLEVLKLISPVFCQDWPKGHLCSFWRLLNISNNAPHTLSIRKIAWYDSVTRHNQGNYSN